MYHLTLTVKIGAVSPDDVAKWQSVKFRKGTDLQ